MRDDPQFDHQCPVADLAPELYPRNEVIATVFRQAESSAEQRAAEDKTYFYLRPETVESLMRVHGVPEDERARVMEGVQILQQVANERRPLRPKPRKR